MRLNEDIQDEGNKHKSTGLNRLLNSMWPTSCAQEGFGVFSHKQNLNSDLDCTTQSTLGHTHKQKYTVSFNSINALAGIFISKGSDHKSGHISHSKGEP